MNFDITFDRGPRDGESPQEAWRRRVDGSILKLKADVTPDDIAAAYPDVTDDVAEELASEAVSNAFEQGDTDGVILEDFPSVDQLDVDADSTDTPTDASSDDDGVPFHKRRDQATDTASSSDDERDTTTHADDDADDATLDAGAAMGATTDQAPPSELDRGELEAEVSELRERVDSMEDQIDTLQTVANRDVALLKGALRRLLDVDEEQELPDIVDAATEFKAAREDHAGRIDTLEREVDHLDSTVAADGGEKEDKVAAIVRMAENRSGSGVVKMTASDVQDATGVSERYSYTLLDDLPEEFGWVLAKPQARQYGSVEIDDRTRAIGIDFEGVHSPGVPLSMLSNGGGE